jgi:hypothetical protein
MPRIKHVLKNPYHAWAHQTYAQYGNSENYAHNSSRNKSFSRLNAYSYRAIIGTIDDVPKVGLVYRLSANSWSNTTNKHQSELWSSVPHDARESGRVFRVMRMGHYDSDHAENVAYLLSQFLEIKGKAERARTNGLCHLDHAVGSYNQAKAYAKVFKVKGVKWPAKLLADLESKREAIQAKTDAANAARDAKREAERIAWEAGAPERARQRAEREAFEAAQEAERAVKRQEALAQWLAGEAVPSYLLYGLPNAYMRVKGATVETTQGADAPAEDVAKALPLVLRVLDSGKEFRPEADIRLGHYRLNSIAEDGTVTVGCHRFAKAEVLRIAEILGVRAIA